MKYLKKIFEATDADMARNSIYSKRLISSIEAYNDRLLKDNVWQEHYKDFINWRKDYTDKRSFDYLKELTEIAQKRIDEIKIEFENNMDFIKDLYLNYLENCKSFSEYSLLRVAHGIDSDSEYGYYVLLTLVFSKETLKNRKNRQPEGFKFTSDEIMDYWKPICDFFTVLESNGYTPRITYYQPNGVELKILIGKNEN